MMIQKPISVFISYAHEDIGMVEQLRTDIEKQGINIWVAHVKLRPGTRDWDAAIRTAIRNVHYVLLIASPASRNSRFVRDELRIAEMYDSPVLPLWVDGAIWIDSVPMGWGDMQHCDIRDAEKMVKRAR